MGRTINLLVTLYYESGNKLVRAALKLDTDKLTPEQQEQLEWLGEPQAFEMVRELLPLHVKSMGPVVQVEQIFSVSIVQFEAA